MEAKLGSAGWLIYYSGSQWVKVLGFFKNVQYLQVKDNTYKMGWFGELFSLRKMLYIVLFIGSLKSFSEFNWIYKCI